MNSSKTLYGINNKTSSPVYNNFYNVNFFNRVTSSHSSTLWLARANLALSNEVYISGNVFFLTGDRFQVYHLFWIYFNSTQSSSTVSQHEAILFIPGLIYCIPVLCIPLVTPLRFNRESKTIERNNWSFVGVTVEYHHWAWTLRARSKVSWKKLTFESDHK